MLWSCVSARLTECVTNLYTSVARLQPQPTLPAWSIAFLGLGICLGLQAKSISVDVYRQQETSPHIPASTSKSSPHLAKRHIMRLQVILPKGRDIDEK